MLLLWLFLLLLLLFLLDGSERSNGVGARTVRGEVTDRSGVTEHGGSEDEYEDTVCNRSGRLSFCGGKFRLCSAQAKASSPERFHWCVQQLKRSLRRIRENENVICKSKLVPLPRLRMVQPSYSPSPHLQERKFNCSTTGSTTGWTNWKTPWWTVCPPSARFFARVELPCAQRMYRSACATCE